MGSKSCFIFQNELAGFFFLISNRKRNILELFIYYSSAETSSIPNGERYTGYNNSAKIVYIT